MKRIYATMGNMQPSLLAIVSYSTTLTSKRQRRFHEMIYIELIVFVFSSGSDINQNNPRIFGQQEHLLGDIWYDTVHLEVILYSYLILKKMNEHITDN